MAKLPGLQIGESGIVAIALPAIQLFAQLQTRFRAGFLIEEAMRVALIFEKVWSR